MPTASPAEPSRPRGYAAVVIPPAVVTAVLDACSVPDDPGTAADRLADRLLAVQLADVGVTDPAEVLVTDDELVTPWAAFTRWTLEPASDGLRLVVARPGERSTLAWSPELGEPGPDTDARRELDEALARVHPALAGLPLTVA